jgi:hypothetical protein
VVELAIRDLKDGAGLRHCPSGKFLANAAWAVIATLAHNLLRWIAAIGLDSTDLMVAKTLRRRLLALPAASPAQPASAGCISPAAGPLGNTVPTGPHPAARPASA